MSLCTVAELRSALGVGSLYADATLQQTCDAADAVILPMLWSPTYFTVAHGNIVGTGTLYFNEPVKEIFYVGQTVTIANSGSSYNGSKVLTAVGDYFISMATNHSTVQPKHAIAPFGTVASRTYTDWTADSAVQEAALLISVDAKLQAQAAYHRTLLLAHIAWVTLSWLEFVDLLLTHLIRVRWSDNASCSYYS
jgi:hypothetical protein